MKRVQMGQFGHAREKQLTVIGTEELESVYGSAENSNYKHKSDKEVAREIKKVKLWKDGEMKTHLVSRLVATAFIPNPENKEEVNHKNGNPLDNSVENLEWVTRSENIRHAFKNGLLQTSKKVALVSKADGVTMKFDSLRAASVFLGRNKGYLSSVIKNGRTLDNYEIVVGEI